MNGGGITKTDTRVLHALIKHARKESSWPGYAAFAKTVKIKSASSVADSIVRLEQAGLVTRLYLQRRLSGLRIETSKKIIPAKTGASRKIVSRGTNGKYATGYMPAPPRAQLKQVIPADAVSFEVMTDAKGCRYPFGDRDYVYCGHARYGKSSYCPQHHDLCHRQTKDEPWEREAAPQVNPGAGQWNDWVNKKLCGKN